MAAKSNCGKIRSLSVGVRRWVGVHNIIVRLLLQCVIQRGQGDFAVFFRERILQDAVGKEWVFGQQGTMQISANDIFVYYALCAAAAVVPMAVYDFPQRRMAADVCAAAVVFKSHNGTVCVITLQHYIANEPAVLLFGADV